MIIGVFYNFIVNDPVIRMIIDKIGCQIDGTEHYMLHCQLQFIHYVTIILYDFCIEDMPKEIEIFQYEYLSMYFRDFIFFMQNDHFPSKKTWFMEEWKRTLKQQFFGPDSYLCIDCMSVSFRKYNQDIEVIDHANFGQTDIEIPEDLKQQIDNNYLL